MSAAVPAPRQAPAAGPAPVSADAGGQPLLEIDRLTVRFGGLTAVCEVDLAVQPGRIVSVIGPNGAGKTTVFNAVTGIYEPSSGCIRFAGKELARPLEKSQLLKWSLVGLSIGVFLMLAVANVDGLWATAVKQNYRGRAGGFSVEQAWIDASEYLAAAPRIEGRAGRFYVVSNDGGIAFGSTKSIDEAKQRKAAIAAMYALGAKGEDAIAPADSGFAILAPGGAGALETFRTAGEARDRLAAVARAAAAAEQARRLRVIVFLLGSAVGAAGAYTVWRQTRRTPAWIAGQGIARTFQNIRLFQEMTVLENVLAGMDRHIAAHCERGPRSRYITFAAPGALALLLALLSLSLRFGWLPPAGAGALFAVTLAATLGYLVWIARLGAFSRHELAVDDGARRDSRELLAFVGLEGQADELSKNLAYGDQRRLEIARALATRPKLLLLDEPAAGMNPSESGDLMKLIRKIRDRGVTILLIEHHMRVVMGISDRIAVLEYGRKIAEGTPDEIRRDPKVIEAYLGKDEVA